MEGRREWVSIAEAAAMMGLCKRQALRLLTRRDGELGGRLLRAVGRKRMPRGEQASKYLVAVALLRETLRPDDMQRDIETMKLEILVLRGQLAAVRREIAANRAPRAP